MSDLDDDELRATRKLYGVEWEEDKQIQVGYYVRTKRGEICKVLGIRKEQKEGKRIYGHLAYYLDNHKGSLTPAFITKHSPNLIDLVECGDYVNGMLVVSVIDLDEESNYIPTRIVFTNRDEKCTLPQLKIYKEDIKTIVTHEQFNSVMYKVKE